eukprot:2981631-Amphidinium_carterae.1
MRTQDCRPLKTKKHKKRPTGLLEETQAASSCSTTPVGEATGVTFPFTSDVRSGSPRTLWSP